MTIFLKQTFDFLSIIKVIFKAIILSDLLLVNQTKHLKFIITFHNWDFKLMFYKSRGELLEIRLLDNHLLDNHLLDTLGSKSTARHKIYQLLESS